MPLFVLDEGKTFVKIRYEIVRQFKEFAMFKSAGDDVGHDVFLSCDMVRDYAGEFGLMYV